MPKKIVTNCTFNPGVACYPTGRHCNSCGWNPKIAEYRTENYEDHVELRTCSYNVWAEKRGGSQGKMYHIVDTAHTPNCKVYVIRRQEC